MRNIVTLLAISGALFGATAVYGQTNPPFSKLGVDASLPLQFGTNVLLAPTNVQSDFSVAPSLKLSALDGMGSAFSYSVYAIGNPEKYSRIETADNAFALAGGKVQEKIGDFAFAAFYEHVLVYDGVFRSLLFQTNDFIGSASYQYKSSTGLTVTPTISAAYRFADLMSQQRFLYTLKVGFEQKVTKDISIAVTPKLRYSEFTDGISAGRRDVRPSVLAMATYAVNADVGISSSVEYDTRWSNRAGKNFSNIVFLASLDFSHIYDLPK